LAVGGLGGFAVRPYPLADDLLRPMLRVAALLGVGSVGLLTGIARGLPGVRGHGLAPDRLAKAILRKVK
jgi:hypothetical protein